MSAMTAYSRLVNAETLANAGAYRASLSRGTRRPDGATHITGHSAEMPPTIEKGDHGDPCLALWRTVIIQAFDDAAWVDPREGEPMTGLSRDSSRRYLATARAQARAWLTGNSIDFMNVCINAEVEPANVLREARKRAANDWRVDGQTPH